DVVRRRHERRQRVAGVGRTAGRSPSGAEAQRVHVLRPTVEEPLVRNGPADADLGQDEGRSRRAKRRVLVNAHTQLEEPLVGVAELELADIAELALLGEATARR